MGWSERSKQFLSYSSHKTKTLPVTMLRLNLSCELFFDEPAVQVPERHAHRPHMCLVWMANMVHIHRSNLCHHKIFKALKNFEESSQRPPSQQWETLFTIGIQPSPHSHQQRRCHSKDGTIAEKVQGDVRISDPRAVNLSRHLQLLWACGVTP